MNLANLLNVSQATLPPSSDMLPTTASQFQAESMLASLRADRPLMHILSTQLQLQVEHEHLLTRQRSQSIKPLENLIVSANQEQAKQVRRPINPRSKH
jgi:hypothetical protein